MNESVIKKYKKPIFVSMSFIDVVWYKTHLYFYGRLVYKRSSWTNGTKTFRKLHLIFCYDFTRVHKISRDFTRFHKIS